MTKNIEAAIKNFETNTGEVELDLKGLGDAGKSDIEQLINDFEVSTGEVELDFAGLAAVSAARRKVSDD